MTIPQTPKIPQIDKRIQYRFGWYKKPSEHHGHPVFIKYRPTDVHTQSHTDGYSRTPDNLEIIGHVYLLPTTYRRFLSILRRKEAASILRRKRELIK
jgi:hypothetical protein